MKSRKNILQLEALEQRDVLSASPLPVLLVLPNRDSYYSQRQDLAGTVATQDSFYGRGILKSTDAGKTWTLNPLNPQDGNETLTSGIDQAMSDYNQWRSRFGSGL